MCKNQHCNKSAIQLTSPCDKSTHVHNMQCKQSEPNKSAMQYQLCIINQQGNNSAYVINQHVQTNEQCNKSTRVDQQSALQGRPPIEYYPACGHSSRCPGRSGDNQSILSYIVLHRQTPTLILMQIHTPTIFILHNISIILHAPHNFYKISIWKLISNCSFCVAIYRPKLFPILCDVFYSHPISKGLSEERCGVVFEQSICVSMTYYIYQNRIYVSQDGTKSSGMRKIIAHN